MAISRCIKCDGTFFEMVENSPAGSRFKYNFIQCSKCGGVVAAVDYYNLGQGIEEIKQKLGI
jgi:hydrogenase maturation factor HypF (carbamoyltransferase family)